MATPEGAFFYVSASLREGSSFTQVQDKIFEWLGHFNSPSQDLSWVPIFGRQQAQALMSLPNVPRMRSQVPPSVTDAMLEMNIGLQWGLNEFRYGSFKSELAKRLSELKAEETRRVASNYLGKTSCSVISMQPSSQ